MKLTYEGENGLKFEANHPDEQLKNYWIMKLRDVLDEEFYQFCQEVSVAMRQQKPGTKIVLKSRPITVMLVKPKPVEIPE